MSSRKKNGKKRRKLGSLLLLLFLTIILLATSTYAWFTANRSVTIDAINVTVSTSNGIQISTDANSWKTLISNSDITTGYAFDTDNDSVNDLVDQNQFSLTNLSPVSTAGAVSNGKLVMYKGVIDDKNTDGVLGLTASATPAEAKSTTTGDFIAFDIFLKVDEAGPVYLNVGSGAVVTGNNADKGAQNAVRMGFIVEGNGASTTPAATLAAYSSGSSVLIVEPNSDQHNAFGIEQARQYYQDYTYGSTSGADYTSLSEGTGNDWVSWDGVSAAISDSNEIAWANTNAHDSGSYFTAMTGNYLTRTTTAFTTNTGTPAPTPVSIGLSLSAGITKIRVYLWIEGQDIDCDTSASGANITFNIGFTLDQ